MDAQRYFSLGDRRLQRKRKELGFMSGVQLHASIVCFIWVSPRDRCYVHKPLRRLHESVDASNLGIYQD